MVVATSMTRCKLSQIVFTPGSPSPFRATPSSGARSCALVTSRSLPSMSSASPRPSRRSHTHDGAASLSLPRGDFAWFIESLPAGMVE
ncbi:INTERPRO: probable Binding-protein-dependent transport systems inner membrane component [Aromatoleum aromaticum EbN1]|uniref:INTERPRO: probable Binding-protein-dependent transport systems inner membrane component n=1 Tax=Aromatoleum aromaticum (strain DSM 19018 / LMG 30748 / EbN1) TaxID=76114 RepID=Q5P444_AROAE|nr:INTERPRO: probable Binding-protein-dependent transport systems inner membrane component [Aromatoleum aromaticum EbN1]